MMIVLTVLKIIGIVLLCIIALALLIIAAVLFIPLRYRIEANYNSESGDYDFFVDIRWLFKFLHIIGNYSSKDGLEYWAKICGKKIFPGDDGEDDYSELEEELYSSDEEAAYSPEPVKKDTVSSNQDEVRSPDSEGLAEETTEKMTEDDPSFYEAEKETQESRKNPIRSSIKRIEGIFQNIGYTIKSLCDKIKKIKDKIDYYRHLLEEEETKRVLAKTWSEIRYFLRKIKPKKLSLHVCYGADDPSDTGIMYGRYAALSPFLGKSVLMEVDFNKKILIADLFMKGCLRLVVLLIIAGKLYFDKGFKLVLKKFRHPQINKRA